MFRFMTLFACLAILLPHNVHAAPKPDTIDLQYRIFAGGFKALDASVRFDFTPTRYSTVMKAKPYGVIGYILPWAGEYASKGRIVNGRYIPDLHTKISQWREDNDQYRLEFRNGTLSRQIKTSIDGGVKRTEDRMPEPSYYKGAIDLMTAITEVVVRTGEKKNCTAEPDIYDGKRRYHLEFTDKGVETLPASNLNMFQGKARLCEVEMDPQVGYGKEPKGYYKIQEEARARGQLPRVWLAQLWPDGPMIPVKMLVKSEYGAVFIHLQSYKHTAK